MNERRQQICNLLRAVDGAVCENRLSDARAVIERARVLIDVEQLDQERLQMAAERAKIEHLQAIRLGTDEQFAHEVH